MGFGHLLPLLLSLLLLAAAGLAVVLWTGARTRHPLDLPLLFLSGALALPPVLALLLADLNRFHILWVWVILLLLVFTGVFVRPRSWGPLPSPRLKYTLLGGLILLALLFSRPFEYLLGGWDPGEYISTALHIDRTGGIDYTEPFLRELPQELEHRFFRKWSPPRRTLHAGYLVLDAETGHMVPDYFHLYPAWLSLFASHGGLSSAYPGQTVLAVLSTLILLLTVARMTSMRTAGFMGLFFVTQPAVLYFARFTSSEFLSIGLLASLLAVWTIQEASSTFSRSLWTAVVVYGAVTCHITNLLPLAGMGIMGVLLGFNSLLRTPGRELLVLGTSAGMGFIRNMRVTPVFSAHLVQEYVIETPFRILLILIIPTAVGAVGWLIWIHYKDRVFSFPLMKIIVRWGPAILILSAALYHYFLRTHWSDHADAINFKSLGWVISPVGLLLSVMAFFTFDWRKTDRGVLLLLAAAGVSAAVLVQHKNVQPIYFWAYRRYIPMVFPMLAFLMAWAVERAWTGPWRKWAAPLIGVCGLFSLGWQLRAALPVIKVREHQGLVEFVTRLSEPLADTQFLVVDHWKLASPLRHGFGLPAYSLTREPEPLQAQTQALLHAFLLEQATNHSPAHYLTHSSPFATPGLQVTPLFSTEHQSEVLEWRRNSLPREQIPTKSTAHVYALTPSQRAYDPALGPIEIHIGYHSLGLASGFYGHTSSRGRGYRWTDGNARLYVPAFATPSTLTLSLAHMRPDSLGSTVDVTLRLDGEPLTTLTLGPGWSEHEVELPAGTSSCFALEILSDTWNPTDFEIEGYPSTLGIRVEHFRVTPRTEDESR